MTLLWLFKAWGWARANWRVIVAVLAVAAVGWSYWRVYSAGHDAGKTACEASHTAAVEAAQKAQKKRDERYRETVPAREDALVRIATPLPPPDPRALVREVIREIPGPCRCDGISPDFRLRFNAASDRARTLAAGAVPR